jgi:hypothetical protein
VALSRVRRLSGLHLLGINKRALEVHPEIFEKDAEFRDLSLAAEESFGKLPLGELEKLQANFVRACGGAEPIPGKKGTGDKVKTKSRQSSASPEFLAKMEKLRTKHPRAYTPWTAEDDAELSAAFKKTKDEKKLSKKCGRQETSIHARLIKLRLIEDDGRYEGDN